MSRRIIPLAPMKSGGFSYGSKGLATQGIALESSARIHELLFPEELVGTHMQKRAREDAKKIVTIPWIIAQLKFYDIEFESKAKKLEIKELLMNSVKGGLCDSLPPRVKNIERNLKREYTSKNNEHVAIQSKHLAEIAERRMQYQRQQELAWEAKMQKHNAFLERYHGPEPGQPFSIANVQGTYVVQCNEISDNWPKANGLSLKITSGMGNGCVGVFDFVILKGVMEFDIGPQSIFLEPSDFNIDGGNGSEEFTPKKSWAEEYNNNAAEQFNMGSLVFDHSHESNPHASNPFSANPFTNPTKRSNLVPSPPNLHFHYTNNADDAAEQVSREDFIIDHSHESNPYSSNPFATDPSRNPKMRSTLSVLPPRFPFRWRGDESSLDIRLLDSGDDKIGHLDFSDARCVAFDAEANLKFVGGKVKFKGFKVDDDATSDPLTKDREESRRNAAAYTI